MSDIPVDDAERTLESAEAALESVEAALDLAWASISKLMARVERLEEEKRALCRALLEHKSAGDQQVATLRAENATLRAEVEQNSLALQEHQCTGDYEMGQINADRALTIKLQRLRAVIRENEWSGFTRVFGPIGDAYITACPSCGGCRGDGHAPDCRLADALNS